MEMTAGDIKMEYKLAKDKTRQVGILAQLNQCSEKKIIEMLGDEYEGETLADSSAQQPEKIKRPYRNWSAIHDEILGGATIEEVAAKYDMSVKYAKAKLRDLKKRVKEDSVVFIQNITSPKPLSESEMTHEAEAFIRRSKESQVESVEPTAVVNTEYCQPAITIEVALELLCTQATTYRHQAAGYQIKSLVSKGRGDNLAHGIFDEVSGTYNKVAEDLEDIVDFFSKQ